MSLNHPSPSRSPEYALLGFLYTKPCYGYELYQELSNELGHIWHSSLSQTYNILKRLESKGYVKTVRREQKKLPARQVVTLTAAGLRRFNDWLETPSGSSVRAVRVEFLTRLYFIQHLHPDRIPTTIDAQIAEIQSSLTRLQAALADTPALKTFNHLGLELRIRQLQSIIDWLHECQAELIAPTRHNGDKKR